MNLVDIINPIQWFSGCILLVLASFGFKYRNEEIARGVIGFLLLSSLWCFCVALMHHSKEVELKILINKIKLLAIFSLPYFVLRISISFLENESRAKQILKYFWVVPLFFIIINLGPYHYLINTDYFINSDTGLLHFRNGKLFGLHYALGRIVFIISLLIMWQGSANRHNFHRRTATLIITSILFPFIVDSTIQNVMPELSHYQLVPVAFMVTGIIMAYAIFFHRGLEAVPYSRSRIIDDLKAPCLMWGEENKLVDCNISGNEIFNLMGKLNIKDQKLICDLKTDGKELVISNKIYRVTYSEINQSNNSRGYSILTDITETKKSENDLKRISKLKTDVLGVISHDMGGMLGLLSLNADVLYQNFSKLNDQNKIIIAEKICEQAREINRFSSDLVEWSKDQFAQESFERQKANIKEIVEFVADEIKALADIKNQKINIKIDKTKFLITNIKLLEIILRNLILNAIKHGDSDSQIKVEYDEKEIRIINSGEFKDYERLNLFFIDQEKNTYSGLGLKICKEFSQFLDYWIEFEVRDLETIAKIKGIKAT